MRYRYAGRTSNTHLSTELNTGQYKVIYSLFDERWRQICGPKEHIIQIENGLRSNAIVRSISDDSNNQISADIKLFPNPTSNHVFVNLSDFDGKEMQIMVHDNIGRMLYEELTTERLKEINTFNWKEGLYVVSVRDKEGLVITKKLIISR